MRFIYIISVGKLFRKENNLFFIDKNKEKKQIPVETISSIFIMNKVSLTSNAIDLLLRKGISVHFFKEDRNSRIFYYLGSLLPRQKNPAGIIHIKQVEAYLDLNKRVKIALELVDAIRYNMIKVLEKYKDLKEYTKKLREINVFEHYNRVAKTNKDFTSLVMGIESHLWQIFYEALDKILKYYKLERRTRRPPKNEANAIVSFVNSLLYAVTLSEIYKTHLDPTISFLHEPFERRFSLALDLAEPFKPIITYRILIWLVNQNILKEEHFDKNMGGILLSHFGKKVVISEFDRRINETIKLKNKPRKSILYYIRKQAYNLERALIENIRFEAFRLRY